MFLSYRWFLSYRLRPLFYLMCKKALFRFFLKRPIFYLKNILVSFRRPAQIFKYSVPKKDSASASFNFCYLYGVENRQKLKQLIADTNYILLIGVSYCQKPPNCPCGRFTENCSFNIQKCPKGCFIHLLWKKLPEKPEKMIIITVEKLALRFLELLSEGKKVIFLISACFLALKMFDNFAFILGLKGCGLPLIGPVCFSFKDFIDAEKGKKEKKTNLSRTIQKEFLYLVQFYSQSHHK